MKRAPDAEDLHYYGPPQTRLHFHAPRERVRIAFLTSIRDLAEEKIGQHVRLPREGNQYMKGTIESTVEEIRAGVLAKFVTLVAIITDDTEDDLKATEYPIAPTKGSQWIHPLGLRGDTGEYLLSQTYHIPSTYRSVSAKRDPEKKAALKYEFEEKLYRLLRQQRVEVLVTDHFLCLIENLIREDCFNLLGRIVNIHPAITRLDHPRPLRGKDPYNHAIHGANGYRIDPVTNERVLVPPYFRTGAALHFTARLIDDGLVLADAERTPVYANDTELDVTWRTYQYSKQAVLEAGLRHFFAHIHPVLSYQRLLSKPWIRLSGRDGHTQALAS